MRILIGLGRRLIGPLFVVSLCVEVVFVNGAHGDELDRFGVGAETTGAGGVSLLSNDPASIFSNPAALSRVDIGARAGIEFTYGRTQIIGADRPASVDVAPSIQDAQPVGNFPRPDRRALPTSILSPRTNNTTYTPSHSVYVAAATSFFNNRLFVGAALAMPLGPIQSQKSFFIDEREQFFSNQLRWWNADGDQRSLLMNTSVALRIHKLFTIGIGVFFEQNVTTQAAVYVPDALNGGQGHANVTTEVNGAFAPTTGLSVGPFNGLRIETSVQAARQTDIRTESIVRIRGLEQNGSDKTIQRPTFLLGQVPARIEYAASYKSTTDTVHVGLSVIQQFWSSLRSMHDEVLYAGIRNGIQLRAGIVVRASPKLTVRFGFAHAPSPVPEQQGRSNVVDNDRSTWTLGASYQHAFSWGEMFFSLSSRLTRLWPRSHTKAQSANDPIYDEYPDSVDAKTNTLIQDSLGFQSNNPGFPSFSSQGWIGATTLSIGIRR